MSFEEPEAGLAYGLVTSRLQFVSRHLRRIATDRVTLV
jgi:hypothetical protein